MLLWFIDGIERMRSARLYKLNPSSTPTNNIQYASSSCSSSVNINAVMDAGACEYITYQRNSSPMTTTTCIASTDADANNPIGKVSTQSINATINLRISTSESASKSTSEYKPPIQPPIGACYILTIENQFQHFGSSTAGESVRNHYHCLRNK